MEQHGANREKAAFDHASVIYGDELNKSVITDYEHCLILLMSAVAPGEVSLPAARMRGLRLPLRPTAHGRRYFGVPAGGHGRPTYRRGPRALLRGAPLSPRGRTGVSLAPTRRQPRAPLRRPHSRRRCRPGRRGSRPGPWTPRGAWRPGRLRSPPKAARRPWRPAGPRPSARSTVYPSSCDSTFPETAALPPTTSTRVMPLSARMASRTSRVRCRRWTSAAPARRSSRPRGLSRGRRRTWSRRPRRRCRRTRRRRAGPPSRPRSSPGGSRRPRG